jgi:hypothetical protein
VDAEGCFFVTYTNNSTGVGLVFKVTQHIRDDSLLKEFINYFNCGRYIISSKEAGDYIVTKFSDINMKIIPFFNKYPILGSKSLDFSDFEQVAKLIENKDHLTAEGFKQISKIKSGMNKGRIYNIQSTSHTSTSPPSAASPDNTGKIALRASPYKCSQKRTYVTVSSSSAFPKFAASSRCCQGNKHYSIKLNNTHTDYKENLFNE